MKPISQLVVGSLLGWGVIYFPTLFLSSLPIELGLIAIGITLIPAIMTLGVYLIVKKKSPQIAVFVVLAGVMVRGLLSLGGGGIFYLLVPNVKEYPLVFLGWGLGCYLLTLTIETVILYRLETRPSPQG